MKKLKIKVFSVIFIILTAFTIGILIVATAKSYYEEKNSITDVLTNISRMNKRIDNIEERRDFPPDRNSNQSVRRIFLDFTIYTIVLDDEGNYKEIINNTFEEEIDEDKVKSVAEKIINNHKDDLFVGNLYIDNYSYVFTQEGTLIIMDNTSTNKMLVGQLIYNLFKKILIIFI